MTNIPSDKSHMYANQGSSMVLQHKSLPDGTGSGMGWILANKISKSKFVMQHQEDFLKQHQQQQQPQFGGNMSQQHQG